MDQASLPGQKAFLRVTEVPGHLTDPQPVRLPGDSTDLHPPTRQVDEEEHQESGQPLARPTSMVKKSAATITARCRDKNSFHVVFRSRSGAGSKPCSFRRLAIVPRATSWPRLANAPGFSGSPNLGSPWPCGPPAAGSPLGCANDLGLAACCPHISWRSACDASPAVLLASRWWSVH